MNSFPKIFDIRAFRIMVDNAFEWVVIEFGERIELVFLPLLRLLEWTEEFFLAIPWYLVLLFIAGTAYYTTRSRKVTFGLTALSFLMGVLGLWESAMSTTALMLISTLIAIAIGIPTGIAMSRSKKMEITVLPILDIMQTMPIFVYLIPFVMLLGPGKVPALLATIVFAVPPVIRLTNLGIRQVDTEVVEAYTAFGGTKRQILFNVQLPLSLPTIMAGINQTTMMALSMVVIASMIGAGGLGYQVLQGIQRLEISRGLLAGLGIVILAVTFDRIAQAQGKRMQQHLNINN